jgi:hypothetical protein
MDRVLLQTIDELDGAVGWLMDGWSNPRYVNWRDHDAV